MSSVDVSSGAGSLCTTGISREIEVCEGAGWVGISVGSGREGLRISLVLFSGGTSPFVYRISWYTIPLSDTWFCSTTLPWNSLSDLMSSGVGRGWYLEKSLLAGLGLSLREEEEEEEEEGRRE